MTTHRQAADDPATTSTVAASSGEEENVNSCGDPSAADDTAYSSSVPAAVDEASEGNATDDDSIDVSDNASSDYEFEIYDDDETIISTKAKPAQSKQVKQTNPHAMTVNTSLGTWPLRSWDPGFKHKEASPLCQLRIKRDIMDVVSDPPPGVHIAPVEHNANVIHALVLGPADTPYQGGFFHFVIHFPEKYPMKPPVVRLMNTDGGRVRFNPNLHECGDVFLSILGTCAGPAWSPAMCLSSVLTSIQSLLTEKPYFDDPGCRRVRRQGESELYNSIVQHETIRVAVCDAVEASLKGSSPCPAPLRKVMLKSFKEYYDKYEVVVQSNITLTGNSMHDQCLRHWHDPFGRRRGTYVYETLLRRLRALKGKVQEWLKKADDEEN